MKKTLFLALTALLSTACKKDRCESEPPSFQLDVTVADRASEISTLRVELRSSLGAFARDFDTLDKVADGSTSIAVELQPAPELQTSLNIKVLALNAQGETILAAEDRFDAQPNGCNRFSLALLSAAPIDAGPASDFGVDLGPEDGGALDAGEDLGPKPDQGDAGPDAGVDAGADTGEDLGVDMGPEDLGVPEGCQEQTDPNTVALYPFSNDANDLTGAHPGAVVGNTGFGAGPPMCGSALELTNPPVVSGHVSIPDDAAFDLSEGSVDFWMFGTPASRAAGLLSRDASGEADGHLSIWLSCDGTVVARLETDGAAFYQCAPGAPQNAWAHIGVNFGSGGFELFVDGVRAQSNGQVGLLGNGCAQSVQCGTSTTSGIAGNDNPWIVGASAHMSDEGTGRPLRGPFRNGRIDALRISNVTRAF